MVLFDPAREWHPPASYLLVLVLASCVWCNMVRSYVALVHTQNDFWDSIYDDNGHSQAYFGVERFLVRVGPIPT